MDEILFTERALAAIQKARTGIPEGYLLRLGMRGGGCSGMSYLMGFDQQREQDIIYHCAGMDVMVDKAHGMYLLGMEVDYVDEPERKGFIFNNPKERKS